MANELEHSFDSHNQVANNTLNCSCNNDTIDLLAVNPTEAYPVIRVVSGIKVRFMLDTGASVSLLSGDMWEQVSKGANVKATALEPWTGPRLTGVEGSPIVIHGVASIDITLAGEIFSADILVASGLSTQAILGLDFYRESSA